MKNPLRRARSSAFKRAPVACALAGLLAGLFALGSAQAQNLPELFAAARAHDASFEAALAQFEADRARAAQAQAGVRPSVALSGGASWTHRDSSLPGPDRLLNQQQLTLGASQPLFRPANQLALQQAQWALQAAQARLQSAEQDLIVRTAQATFDVLAAQDAPQEHELFRVSAREDMNGWTAMSVRRLDGSDRLPHAFEEKQLGQLVRRGASRLPSRCISGNYFRQ